MKAAVSLCAAALGIVLFWQSAVKEKEEIPGQEKPVSHIVMTYDYMDSSCMDDLDEVMEAVNEITREEIGVEVELKRENVLDSFIDYPLWLSQGKRIDLMLINYQDITSYVEQEMLRPLEELLDESEHIQNRIEQGEKMLSVSGTDSRSYGLRIPDFADGISGGGIWMPKRYLDEVSFPYEKNHIYGWEELEVLFKHLKEKYPNSYPLGQLTAGYTFSTYSFYKKTGESLGAGLNSGYLDENNKIKNFFESVEYYDFLKQMRSWYEEGFIYPDSAFGDVSNTELLKAGKILSIPLASTPGMFSVKNTGEVMACLRTTEVFRSPAKSQAMLGSYWVIPYTSQEPEAAMRFLDMMFSDERIVNLFQWGIEDRHYRVLDRKKGIIDLATADGKAFAGYSNPLGLYGDPRFAYTSVGDASKEEFEEYADTAVSSGVEYSDFFFDSRKVSVELAQIQSVVSRYLPMLESGCVEVDKNYEEFISELKNAGIDQVMEEKQRQFDEWKAARENGIKNP